MIMPDTMSKNNEQTADISIADVIAYLKANPQFLNENPEICDILTPPRAAEGKGVVDFQHYMVRRLREDRDDIIEEARTLVENTRANAHNLSRIHQAVLLLLEAQNFEDFIHVMTMDFASLLDVDIVSLVVETDGQKIPHINLSGVHAVSAGTVDLLMRERPVILESDISGFEEIYGGGAGLVKSQALLRLTISHNVPCALLAFGSRDPHMFDDGQGTEQILFLGQVIERCIRSWLTIPR